MSGHAMGQLTCKVGGQEYRLWLGMSVLADVQAKFPAEFDALVAGSLGMPPMQMILAMVSGALERWHPVQAADRYFVDELLNENEGLFQMLLNASGPAPGDQSGKAGKPKARPR